MALPRVGVPAPLPDAVTLAGVPATLLGVPITLTFLPLPPPVPPRPGPTVWIIVKYYASATKPPALVKPRWSPALYYWTAGSAWSPNVTAAIRYPSLIEAQTQLLVASVIWPEESINFSVVAIPNTANPAVPPLPPPPPP